MTNPIADDSSITASDYAYDGTGVNPKIINASAIAYKDFWRPYGVKLNKIVMDNTQFGSNNTTNPVNNGPEIRFTGSTINYYDSELNDQDLVPFPGQYRKNNPFLHNIKGDWRAVKSYAYLSGRGATADDSPRNSGFFTSFSPFYVYENDVWTIPDVNTANTNNWTFASEVTKYGMYGVELENKDALNRYSSAQYGYNYTLPIAVASNSEHRQIGYDGFEDATRGSHFQAYRNVNFGALTIDDPELGIDLSGPSDTEVTNEAAHTGRYSLKVISGTSHTSRHSINSPDTDWPLGDQEDCSAPYDCPGDHGIEKTINVDYTSSTTTTANYLSLFAFPNSGYTIESVGNAVITSGSSNCMSINFNDSSVSVYAGNCNSAQSVRYNIELTFEDNTSQPAVLRTCTYKLRIEACGGPISNDCM